MTSGIKSLVRKSVIEGFVRCLSSAGAMFFLVAIFASPVYAQEVSPGEGAMGAVGVILLVAAFIAGVAGFSLVWKGLFPGKVEWTTEIARRMTWRSFGAGFGISIFLLFLIALFAEKAGPIALLLLIVFLVLIGALGVASMVEWVGEMVDPAAAGLRKSVLGSGAWSLMVFIPILGWLAMGGLLMVGIGAAFVSYFSSRKPVAPPVEIPPEPREAA